MTRKGVEGHFSSVTAIHQLQKFSYLRKKKVAENRQERKLFYENIHVIKCVSC